MLCPFNNKLSWQNAEHFLQFYDIKVSNIVDNHSTLVTKIIKEEKEEGSSCFSVIFGNFLSCLSILLF